MNVFLQHFLFHSFLPVAFRISEKSEFGFDPRSLLKLKVRSVLVQHLQVLWAIAFFLSSSFSSSFLSSLTSSSPSENHKFPREEEEERREVEAGFVPSFMFLMYRVWVTYLVINSFIFVSLNREKKVNPLAPTPPDKMVSTRKGRKLKLFHSFRYVGT